MRRTATRSCCCATWRPPRRSRRGAASRARGVALERGDRPRRGRLARVRRGRSHRGDAYRRDERTLGGRACGPGRPSPWHSAAAGGRPPFRDRLRPACIEPSRGSHATARRKRRVCRLRGRGTPRPDGGLARWAGAGGPLPRGRLGCRPSRCRRIQPVRVRVPPARAPVPSGRGLAELPPAHIRPHSNVRFPLRCRAGLRRLVSATTVAAR